MDTLTYKLEQFEGPLDLLLTLIHKNKVSISDIPIALICDQYIEYLNAANELNMDIASEFINKFFARSFSVATCSNQNRYISTWVAASDFFEHRRNQKFTRHGSCMIRCNYYNIFLRNSPV